MNDLETRLQDALTDLTENVQVRGDAWQEHQRRFGTRHPRRNPWLAAAAVVIVLAVGLVVVAAALLDHDNHTGAPASGSRSDPWAGKNYLGAPVVAETLTMGGQQVRHELVLTDTDGKGPSLCDRYLDGSSDSGGCTSRDPVADTKGVAFDWLTGSQGGGLHSVVGAVDDRVMKVQVWMSNGDAVLAVLHPTGWEGTRMFALTVPETGPTPQRVVAFSDATGTVLQGIDLGDRFGSDWLPHGSKSCAGTVTGRWPQPGSGGAGDVAVVLWGASAKVTINGTDTVASTCLGLGPGALAGSMDAAGHIVVVTGPEVVTVELRSLSGATVAGSSRKVAPSAGSPFQVADLPDPPPNPAGYRIVALDVTDQVVDRTDFSSDGH